MLITESVLSFSFPEKKKIRQKALELEKHLEDFIALPLNIFSVPEAKYWTKPRFAVRHAI